jgi:hypothetical protein
MGLVAAGAFEVDLAFEAERYVGEQVAEERQ